MRMVCLDALRIQIGTPAPPAPGDFGSGGTTRANSNLIGHYRTLLDTLCHSGLCVDRLQVEGRSTSVSWGYVRTLERMLYPTLRFRG
ncbi:hypothetical protein FA13DRAFT_1736364 [Coprinellus micaceus]|uniref:Uncharacterized protein n=1 Tax=Coprinellus micaceus TaxID=71717 RepID=A0A4Y7T075_COPMI|nr:hypothetical protein FA13DRAFT_1736364 [Coprinellus micaceus]